MKDFVECAGDKEREREQGRVETAAGLSVVESVGKAPGWSQIEGEITTFASRQGPPPCSSSLEGMTSKVAG
jgi:hypothetical protein